MLFFYVLTLNILMGKLFVLFVCVNHCLFCTLIQFTVKNYTESSETEMHKPSSHVINLNEKHLVIAVPAGFHVEPGTLLTNPHTGQSCHLFLWLRIYRLIRKSDQALLEACLDIAVHVPTTLTILKIPLSAFPNGTTSQLASLFFILAHYC